MVFRRILAGFLALLFVGVAIVSFLVFALSNTFFRATFYSEDLREPAYTFLVDSTVLSIQHEDGLINRYFTESDLRREVQTVFPEDLFDRMLQEFVTDFEGLQENPDAPLTLKLGMFRESLLTLAHNLSFRMFENLPECSPEEVPEEDVDGLPSCVPADVAYDDVSGPLSQEFEAAIYGAIPGQLEFNPRDLLPADMNVEGVVSGLSSLRTIFYVMLLVLIALMALAIYTPFTAVLTLEGVAFLVSGAMGLLVALLLPIMPTLRNLVEVGGEYDFMSDVANGLVVDAVGMFSMEVQKAALMFVGLGVALLLFRYYMKNQ